MEKWFSFGVATGVDDIGVEIKPPEIRVGPPNNLQSSR